MRNLVEVTEVEVTILNLGAPVRSKLILDAAAEGPPADAVFRHAQGRCKSVVVQPNAAIEEGPAALDVEESGTGRIAQTTREIGIEAAIRIVVDKDVIEWVVVE